MLAFVECEADHGLSPASGAFSKPMKAIRGADSTGNPGKSTARPVAVNKGLCLRAAMHITMSSDNATPDKKDKQDNDNGLTTTY